MITNIPPHGAADLVTNKRLDVVSELLSAVTLLRTTSIKSCYLFKFGQNTHYRFLLTKNIKENRYLTFMEASVYCAIVCKFVYIDSETSWTLKSFVISVIKNSPTSLV